MIVKELDNYYGSVNRRASSSHPSSLSHELSLKFARSLIFSQCAAPGWRLMRLRVSLSRQQLLLIREQRHRKRTSFMSVTSRGEPLHSTNCQPTKFDSSPLVSLVASPSIKIGVGE
ncbi:hypothetical protein CISG_08250 [Coccidioides immitis RMSCC 3703]|uniref:Uncharacterized protein n=1 Tax=Coccidioides immitis RMSCC 3703 TaxID=454286 RepID=A0A0J8U1A4_COCIT|nr:hypothetical protein CISG_08250 [Coccidioides immitis RMSCC 3703]